MFFPKGEKEGGRGKKEAAAGLAPPCGALAYNTIKEAKAARAEPQPQGGAVCALGLHD